MLFKAFSMAFLLADRTPTSINNIIYLYDLITQTNMALLSFIMTAIAMIQMAY
jgi:hypothetical protein